MSVLGVHVLSGESHTPIYTHEFISGMALKPIHPLPSYSSLTPLPIVRDLSRVEFIAKGS
jgi:hypothetical protein